MHFLFMDFKAFFKKRIKKNSEEQLPCDEKIQQGDAVANNEPVTYNLKNGLNKIIVRRKSIEVLAIIPNGKSLEIVVNPDGEILLFNHGGYGVEFNTTDDLCITFAENNNPKFKLKGGSGHDKIIINEDVILDELFGGDGNDEIINHGTLRNIYGGGGDDVIVNNGIVDSIYGEDGNDTVINNSMVSKYIDVGRDDDHVVNNADVGRYITGGDGTDKLVNNGNIEWSMTEGFEDITGVVNGILYLHGEKFSGLYEKNNLMYQDGKPLSGVSPIDGKNYLNGKERESI